MSFHDTIAAKFLAIIDKKLKKDFNKYLNGKNKNYSSAVAIKLSWLRNEDNYLISLDARDIVWQSNVEQMEVQNNKDLNDDIINIIPNDNLVPSVKMWGLIAFFLYHKIPIELLRKLGQFNTPPQSSNFNMLKVFKDNCANETVALQLWRSLSV